MIKQAVDPAGEKNGSYCQREEHAADNDSGRVL